VRTASIIALMMEAIHTSETSVYYNKPIWHNIQELSNLHTRRRENLKSHNNFILQAVIEIGRCMPVHHTGTSFYS
jgi:hypothetical protein